MKCKWILSSRINMTVRDNPKRRTRARSSGENRRMVFKRKPAVWHAVIKAIFSCHAIERQVAGREHCRRNEWRGRGRGRARGRRLTFHECLESGWRVKGEGWRAKWCCAPGASEKVRRRRAVTTGRRVGPTLPPTAPSSHYQHISWNWPSLQVLFQLARTTLILVKQNSEWA